MTNDPTNFSGSWHCNSGTRWDFDSNLCVACGSLGKTYCVADAQQHQRQLDLRRRRSPARSTTTPATTEGTGPRGPPRTVVHPARRLMATGRHASPRRSIALISRGSREARAVLDRAPEDDEVRAHATASSSGFPSDTNLLVDACIARVRETARLDDDAVLPPLPMVAPRRDVVIFRKEQIAAAPRPRRPRAVRRTRRRETRSADGARSKRRHRSASPAGAARARSRSVLLCASSRAPSARPRSSRARPVVRRRWFARRRDARARKRRRARYGRALHALSWADSRLGECSSCTSSPDVRDVRSGPASLPGP